MWEDESFVKTLLLSTCLPVQDSIGDESFFRMEILIIHISNHSIFKGKREEGTFLDKK